MSKAKEQCDVETGPPRALWEMLIGVAVDLTKHLEGQLCTLMDATISDGRQVKATKDIVKMLLWAAEKEHVTAIERYLSIYSQTPEMKILPDWLEKRLKKEHS